VEVDAEGDDEVELCYEDTCAEDLGPNLKQVIGNVCKQELEDFWRTTLEAPEFILKWLREGYSLNFFQDTPPKSFLPNNGSALKKEHEQFVDGAVGELEQAGAIYEVQQKPHVVLLLQVVFSGGKKRIIVDASRQVNQFLKDGKVRLDHLFKVAPCIDKNSFLTTFDLKSGYYHLRVRESDQKFLGV